MAINLFDSTPAREKFNPKQFQLNLTAFLEKDAPEFTLELWELLVSAQSNPTGIPTEFIEKKKKVNFNFTTITTFTTTDIILIL